MRYLRTMSVRAKKHLGQHFLKDQNIAKQIVDSLKWDTYQHAVEIGPGMGVLTQFLIQDKKPISVVEIDTESVDYLSENYPDLKANQNFLELQSALQSIEGDLANARRYYNATVRDYNTAIQQFPGVIVANMTGFKAREFYELDNEQEAQNVEVKF